MTEQEWLVCADPMVLLRYLNVEQDDDKILLLMLACMTRIEYLLPDPGQQWMEDAWAVVAGDSSIELEPEVGSDAIDKVWSYTSKSLSGVAEAVHDIFCARWNQRDWEEDQRQQREPAVFAGWQSERAYQAGLVRDIFGNPFRPVTTNPAWLTPTVLSLAQAAYDNRNLPSGTLDNARLGVLADALEDAGCDNADILNHLRQPGEHVRGCWVVDLLLGKE